MPHKQNAKQKTPKKRTWFFQKYIAEGQARANRYLAGRPHRSFKPTPRAAIKTKKIAKTGSLIGGTFGDMWRFKKQLGTLGLLFSFAILVLVGTISQINFIDVRHAAQELFSGNLGAVGTTTTLFAAAITGSLNPTLTQLQQFLAIFLVFLFWLVIIWVLRKKLSDKPATIRDALYNAGAPIIPTVVVATVLVFQAIPGALGLVAGSLTLSGVWLQGGVESMLVTVAAALLCVLSVYWIGGSALALVVVSLPGIYPWRALSVASELVIGQRWRLILRIFLMILTVVAVWAALLMPALLLDGWLKFDWLPLIPILVLLLYGFTLVYCMTYIYKMYRSLL